MIAADRPRRTPDAAGTSRPARSARQRDLPISRAPPVAMARAGVAPAGGDQPHNNLQPYLTFYFNIALQGVFPPRG